MTAYRDPNRLISDFLDEGMDELPDRSYDAVRSQIDHTRQRVVFGPWREDQMRRYAIFGIAAAAVVLVAVVGINFLPRNDGIGGQATPTATPTTAPTPWLLPGAEPSSTDPQGRSPSPTAVPLQLPASGSLAAGTYYTVPDPSHIGSTAKRITFSVP